EDWQADALLKGEPRPAVGERVRSPVVGDAEGLAHALARLDVPGPARLDPRLLPQALLENVRARLVAAGDEARLRLRDPLEGLDGLGHAFDLRRILLRPDDDEVVVHDEAAIQHLPFGDVATLELGSVGQRHVRLAPGGEGEGLARAHGDGLYAQAA